MPRLQIINNTPNMVEVEQTRDGERVFLDARKTMVVEAMPYNEKLLRKRGVAIKPVREDVVAEHKKAVAARPAPKPPPVEEPAHGRRRGRKNIEQKSEVTE